VEALVGVVPENLDKPGRDVLDVGMTKRGHYIHEVMASVNEPLSVAEIARRAEPLARQSGYPVRSNTFSIQVTRNHLVWMRDHPERGYAEQLHDGRWQLTARAWQRIRNQGTAEPRSGGMLPVSKQAVRTVDDRSRLILPTEFANATVTLERVGENEIRIRKAVVVPVDELPLIEDQLRPLSDRDRDLFLQLLENPPEPTPSFLKAAKEYRKRHGRVAHRATG
jgi:hypothetical protein